MKKILTIAALVALSSCAWKNPMPQTTSTFKSEAKENSRPFRAKVANFFYPEVDHRNVTDPVPTVTTQPYCYKTWDKPVCYTQPMVGEEEREVGKRDF